MASLSGGTDIVGCFVGGNPLSPVYRGEIQGPILGMDVHVFDENGLSVSNKKGELVCKKSFPTMPIKFWHDQKGAKINSIRIRKNIKDSDIVVVKFGEKYRQWNAAFDAGFASALNKSMIVIHSDEHQHALKEVDASAVAVAKDQEQVVRILKYVLDGTL